MRNFYRSSLLTLSLGFLLACGSGVGGNSTKSAISTDPAPIASDNFAAFDPDDDRSGSVTHDSVSGLFSNGSGSPCRRQRRRRHRRCMNRHYRIESVRTSCWYLNFLKPGQVRDMTHELSLSDRYG